MRTIIKEEVTTQLPQIIPQAVSDFANLVIKKNVAESLEVVVLTRSTSQPKSTYEAAASLFEFELTKILIDKMKKNKSNDKADYKRELYDALIKSYETDKDLFDSYGEAFTLKRSRDDQDKDRDPSVGSNKGTKRRKSSKDAESSSDSRSKEKKSSTTSKEASHSQHKSPNKSAHVEEPSHIVEDSGVHQDQEFVTRDNDEQPTEKEVTKADWFKKPDRPPTPDPDWSTSHWGPKRQSFYGFVANMTSSKDVYSRKRIIGVTRLSIMKKYDYGHLEEIQVGREDQELRIVIQRRVEDLQLGVESYQKKLNLTKPYSYRSNLRNRTAYTSYSDPHGTIYVDQFGRTRLLRTDELYKFSDGTLNDVWSALHDIDLGIRIEYLPKKKWSNLDKKRARVMVQDIDKKLFERRLMRNLEKFVGGRKYGNDLRLLERII
ncbi:hypothetical protein Tco_1205487 [Tanacetum coccineum]